MQVLELVKYYIPEFELRVVRLRINLIRKISTVIPTVVVNWKKRPSIIYDLFVNLSCHLNINNLLFGDSNLPDCENESNFLVIQEFIIKSKRFTPRI
jgi:hypothetical protein